MNEDFLIISLHWPHDRFCLGWDFVNADKEYNFSTFKLFLFICTIEINF